MECLPIILLFTYLFIKSHNQKDGNFKVLIQDFFIIIFIFLDSLLLQFIYMSHHNSIDHCHADYC
jgi:RsiW-degrading membrane proteinase PrsW (M82 family)